MVVFARRRVVSSLLAGAAVAVLAAVPAAHAEDAAAKLIETVAAQVIELVKSKPAGPEREAGIRQVLEQYFDLPYMGRSALATHWEKTSGELRERFLKAAIAAEARAYSERFGQYGGQTLTTGREFQRAGATVVDSRLNQSNGQPIKMEWDVRNGRITDVRIEGVSMVATRRSDFNSYIQNHGGKVEPLVEELEARAKTQ